jgi:hypothetical protein
MQTTRHTVETTAFAVRIEAVTPVDAPPETAWSVLAATGAYGAWNPFVTRFDGQLIPGERIAVELQLEGRKLQKMTPRVVSCERGRSFEWHGQFGPRGVFDGRHRFELRPLPDGRCELVQSEVLSGALVPFFKRMLTGPTPEAFVSLNEAFKARAERVR